MVAPDDCIEVIESFGQLEELKVSGSNVSDRFVSRILDIPSLETISVPTSAFHSSEPISIPGWEVLRLRSTLKLEKIFI